jgi:hypothetical protein
MITAGDLARVALILLSMNDSGIFLPLRAVIPQR